MQPVTLPPLRPERVGFLDAARRFWVHADRYNGRSTRSEYWWATLHLAILTWILTTIGIVVELADGPVPAFVSNLVIPVFAFCTIPPSLALQARRLHDIGHSARWLLICLVPVVGGLVMLVFTLLPGTPGRNRFDDAAPTRRSHGPLRTVGVIVGAVVAGQAVLGVLLGLASANALLIEAMNTLFVEAGMPAEATTTILPGVFTVDVDQTGQDVLGPGVSADVHPVGWILTSLAIAAALVVWDVVMRRHERRVVAERVMPR